MSQLNVLDRLGMRLAGLSTMETRDTVMTDHGPVVRPPSGALYMPDYRLADQPLRLNDQAQRVLTKDYYQTYIFRAINFRAEQLAGCAFRAGNPLTSDFQLNAPLAQLLGPAPGSPNPFMSAATLWKYSSTQWDTIGRYAWLYSKDSLGRIDGVWALMAQHLRPVPADGRSTQIWKRFEYGNKGSPEYQEFSPDDLFYSWNPSPQDWHLPQSVLQSTGIDLAVLNEINQYDYAFLKNGGVPANLIITPPFPPSDEGRREKKLWQDSFVSTMTGSGNAGKVMFAEREVVRNSDGSFSAEAPDSIEVKQLGITQRDAEMGTLRDAKIRDITFAFGTPLSVLGDSTLSRFQNGPDDRLNFYNGTLKPLLRQHQDNVNTFLAPLLGTESGWFDTSQIAELQKKPVLPEGPQAASLEAAGAFTWDEWRAERGLGPAPQREVITVSATVGQPPALPFRTTPTVNYRQLAISSRTTPSTAILVGGKNTDTEDMLRSIMDTYLTNFKEDQLRSIHAMTSGSRGKRLQQNPEFNRSTWIERATELFTPLLTEIGYSTEEQRQYISESVVNLSDHLTPLEEERNG